MRWRTMLMTVSLLPALAMLPAHRSAAGEEDGQLQQAYDDTLAQLRDAQQRKTQLAAENEQLKARVADLERQLKANQSTTTDLQRRNQQLAETTAFLHSHYAAWQQFLHRYPVLQMRWKTFLEKDLPDGPSHTEPPVLVNPEWPVTGQA